MGVGKHAGGRLAANFRAANVAEGLGIQLLRPVAAIATVPREEDYGVDLIATLLRREGRCLVAEDSFVVQIKTHTAARFKIEGDGIRWFRQLRLPYLPLVVNLDKAEATLFTLNPWHDVIHATLVDKYVFVLDEDMDNDPGDEFFSLGEPLMRWRVAECADPQFASWAYSVLKPAIRIEALNQQYGCLSKFTRLTGGPYEFKDRGDNGLAVDPPKVASIGELGIGATDAVLEAMRYVIGSFANWVGNQPTPDDRSDELLRLRDCLRRLGFDPDPDDKWKTIAQYMSEGH